MDTLSRYIIRTSFIALACALALTAPAARSQPVTDPEPLIGEPAIFADADQPVATPVESSAVAEPAAPSVTQYTLHLPMVTGSAANSSAVNVSSLAQQVVDLTNQYRAAAGCRPLVISPRLTTAATAHSQDMATHNFFSHTGSDGSSPWDRIRRTGYTFSTAAENIAAGSRTAEAVVQLWYNSPGHRANMLNCALREIGVAYADGGAYGRYWTQDFATP